MKSAVLLLSGGLDSAANLALAKDFEIRIALTVDYGQLSAEPEVRQAAELAAYFGVEHQVLRFGAFRELVQGSGGVLLENGALPRFLTTEVDQLEKAKSSARAVWVPNRNGVLLSLAAALAESRGLDCVAVGFNAEEAVTFADNTQDFMNRMSEALAYSTRNAVKVVSATATLTKTQIVQELAVLDFPFRLLWSCYEGGSAPCGTCESCARLKRALAKIQSPVQS